MAISEKSAGEASSSATPSGKALPTRQLTGDWIKDDSTPDLLRTLMKQVKKTYRATQAAYYAAETAERYVILERPANLPGLLELIKDEIGHRDYDLTARACIKELQRRSRKGGRHA